jgi:retron-type reverse transcriptase
MSLFDWMMRRNQRSGAEPIVPAAPENPGVSTPGSPPPAPPAAPTPAPEPPSADPYSAADFLPISRAEIVEAGKGGALLRNMWFGRRDLIPPADDPRTKIIDRALVSHGLLTPEELAEIHRVGDEMQRLKPDLNAIQLKAGLAGEAAVRAYREAKEKLKEKKKAEAAARKKHREADVKRRRETDIIFLGRGVSGRLHQRLSDEARLTELGLPVMHAPADVAKALGLSIKQLRWLAFHTEAATRTHYVKFQVPKKSGGTRTLSAPHRTLKNAQRWVYQEIVSRFPLSAAAHGFVPGRGIVTNATPHVGKPVVLNMDLEDFFPSISFYRVRHVFERHGYSGSVATVLALLCTECPRMTVEYAGTKYEVASGPRALPQGAPTSPGLSNQVARMLDKRLLGIAAKLGVTYTRYADDLTYSGGDELASKIGYLMARVRNIARDEGFAVNEKKSRVMRRSAAQTVTGVVVNDKPSVSRDEVRRLRAILHRAKSEGLDAQNREGRPNFRSWLEGKIAFVNMVRPDLGAKLRGAFEAVAGK